MTPIFAPTYHNTRDVDHKTDMDNLCIQISHERFMTKMSNCLKGQIYSLQLMLYLVNSLETSTCNDQEMVIGDRYIWFKLYLISIR